MSFLFGYQQPKQQPTQPTEGLPSDHFLMQMLSINPDVPAQETAPAQIPAGFKPVSPDEPTTPQPVTTPTPAP